MSAQIIEELSKIMRFGTQISQCLCTSTRRLDRSHATRKIMKKKIGTNFSAVLLLFGFPPRKNPVFKSTRSHRGRGVSAAFYQR